VTAVPDDVPLLHMRGIVKQFPGVRALDGIDLTVRPGEVHCLLGQNGAGKSTLIKILSGAQRPDGGEIRWRGEELELTRPVDALRQGIATIYQELDLVEGLTVADNVYLGQERSRHGVLDRGPQRRATREALRRLGHADIDPDSEVADLSPASRQIVSIARALVHDARLIVMDEPTAALAQAEVDNLFRVIGELTSAGVAVVYISHRLEEIRRIGDVVTVLKDGRTVATGLPARTTPTRQIVGLMTGRTMERAFPARRTAADGASAPGAPLLEVRGLTLVGVLQDVDLTVSAGEVVGIAGLVGSGRSELLETVYGARRRSRGHVLVEGRPLRPGAVTAAVRAGVGLAPEERKAQALLLDQPVARNISLASLSRFARAGWFDRREERRQAARSVQDLQIRPADVTRPARTLSGGNQQKVVLARWLLGSTRLLLLDEPTRGVDVGARFELYELVHRLADDGMGVLLVSSDVPEVLGLSDRVLVIRDGHIVHEAPAGDLDEDTVLDLLMEGSAA
jgi:ribose transport system ATP-binding protein